MIQNRLSKEKSPYLLQHANNPVDWYPWCDEAFEKAKSEDKPVFLSIGYSTCHWCHVMAHESFEEEEVAKLMNDAFVSIKVDREERPDIDGIYMTVCQMLTGSGGWPLTIIMTPDKEPFFAGTYFPKDQRFGRPGMLEMIPQIKQAWNSRREEIIKSADKISSAVAQNSNLPAGDFLNDEILEKAFTDFQIRFDEENGGFGNAPKFPTPHNFFFLLRYWKKRGDNSALEMVKKTLIEMRKGGIHDHIGFGFHRYSTDSHWLVPHFEKMLYDQALLATAYIEIYQATKDEIFKSTAEEILKYVMRDMTSPEGGFYSAEDADSEGEEGKFYLWDEEELRNILGEDSNLIIKIFNCEKDGNWIDPTIGGAPGTNILHLGKSYKELAKENELKADELKNKTDRARNKLFKARKKRVHPYKDDKILTDWNGLMISAFAKAAQVFDEKEYVEKAESAVEFIFQKLRTENGRLLHRYRQGEAGIPANIDDYSFLIAGLLDLYEASFKVTYLKSAIELNQTLQNSFWDSTNGGFYFTADDSEKLISRQKEIYDGAIPSGNSVALLNLLKLGRFTGDTIYEKKANQLVMAFSSVIKNSPIAFSQFLASLDFAFGPSKEIVIVGKKNNPESEKVLNFIRKKFIPNKVLLFKEEEDQNLAGIAKFTVDQKPLNGKTTVYVCENFNCKMPVTELKELEILLK
ncbi:MAG TPA: thioredoxin domain-containing protein [Ignavibacteriaceae bacterium]|nr:thioredoxin domain-containing protein [Ignavibacteriaceae bacterium]